VQSAKRMLVAQQSMEFEQAMEQTTFYLSSLRVSTDHQEGVQAFLDKREPAFRGA
jgi:enoyl-CoA hydratase/carnithine racemase